MNYISSNPAIAAAGMRRESNRAARLHEMQEVDFRNQQEDRRREQALDAGLRDYARARNGGLQAPNAGSEGLSSAQNPKANQPQADGPLYEEQSPRMLGLNETDIIAQRGRFMQGQVEQGNGPPPAQRPRQEVVPILQQRDPALEALLNTPGTGRMAMEMVQQREQQRDEAERAAITALAAGDMASFDYFQRRSGLRVPPGVLANAEMAQMTGRGMALADQFYSDNPQQAQAFVRAFLQNGGNMGQAFETAGPPRERSNWTTFDLMREGQNVLAMIDQYGTVNIPRDEEGGYYRTGEENGGRSSSTLPSEARMIEYLIQTGIAANHEEAFQLTRMARSDPAARARLIQAEMEMLREDNIAAATPLTSEQIRQQATRTVDEMLSHGAPMQQAPGAQGPAQNETQAAPVVTTPQEGSTPTLPYDGSAAPEVGQSTTIEGENVIISNVEGYHADLGGWVIQSQDGGWFVVPGPAPAQEQAQGPTLHLPGRPPESQRGSGTGGLN